MENQFVLLKNGKYQREISQSFKSFKELRDYVAAQPYGDTWSGTWYRDDQYYADLIRDPRWSDKTIADIAYKPALARGETLGF